jgi:hypothetical protein
MYMLPRSCVLSDQTRMLGMCGGCVHYLEQSCSEFGKVTEISELLWFLPFYGCLTREKGLPCINIQVIERMPCLQGCICVFNIMLQFVMQYSVKS